MATRLYYRADRYYPIRSEYPTLWDRTALFESFAYGLDTSLQDSPIAESLRRVPVGSSPQDIPYAVFYTKPLIAQSISGTMKGRIAAQESSTSANFTAQVKAYIVDPDGAIKSTLYAGYTGATVVSEFSTAKQNREFPKGSSVTLTPQTTVAGDRIMVVVGVRAYSTADYGATLHYFDGAVGGTDLPEDETSTSGNPWIEFSTDLTFLTEVRLTDFQELVIDPDDAIWKLGAGGGGSVPTQGQIWPRGNP